MANKPKFLKNLLTTASAFTMLAVGASEALGAADFVLQGGNATDAANANWFTAGGAAGGGVFPTSGANPDNIYFGSNHNLALTGAVANPFGGINFLGYGGSITAGAAGVVVTGDIVNDTGAGAVAAATAARGAAVAAGNNANAANRVLVFGGANNTTVGVITGLAGVNFANNNNSLIINGSNQDVTAFFKSVGGDSGAIVVNGNNVTFSGAFAAAGTSVKNFVVNDGKSAIANTNLILNQDLTLGSGGADTAQATIQGGKNVTVREIKGGGVGHGTLTFAGASEVVATIGTNAKLKAIEIGNGTVEFKGTAANADVKATTIKLTHANAVMKLSTRAQTIEGNVSSNNTDLQGVLEINGNFAHTLAGKVGDAADKRLNAVRFTNAGAASKLSLLASGTADSFWVGEVTTDNNTKGILSFGGNAVQSYSGTIGTNGAKLAQVQIHSNDGAGGALTTFTLKDDAEIHAVTLDLVGAGVNNKLILKEGSLIDANVESTGNAAFGVIQVDGESHITGTVGAVAEIGGLAFNAAKTLTIDGASLDIDGAQAGAAGGLGAGNAIVFAGNDGTLAFTKTANTTLTVANAVNGITSNNETGSITSAVTAGNTFTIDSKIGANNAALKSIVVAGGGNLALDGGDVYVKTIDLGGQAASVTLLQNGGSYRIGNLDNSANATMKVNPGANNGVTLLANTGALNLNQILFMDNGSELTVEDGINITTSGGIKNNGGVVGGSLVLDKAHVITGDVGDANSKLGDITLTGNDAAKFTQFKGNVFANNVILNGANTLTQFVGNVTATDIKGNVANEGTVEFINENGTPITVTSDIGAGNAVKVVKVSGGNVEITKNVTSQDGYVFGANSTGSLTLGLDDLGASKVVVGRTDAVNKIIVKDDQDILAAAEIGTQANQLGAIVLDNAAAKLIKVSTDKFFSGIEFAQDQVHNVEINNDTVKISDIGAADKRANAVTFSAGTTAEVGDLFAKSAVINDGKVITFRGTLDVVNGLVLGNTVGNGQATAKFGDGMTINSKVDSLAATVAGKLSTVEFLGGAEINADLGGTVGLAAVNFSDNSGNKEILLNTNTIKGLAINLNKNTYNVNKSNVTLTGKVTAANSTVNLNKNTLTFTDSNASAFTGEVALNTSFDGTNYGKIAVTGAGNSVNLNAGVTKLTVTIDDSASSLQEVSGKTITLVGADGQATFTFADAAKVVVNGKDDFVQWTYTGQNAVFSAQNNATNALTNIGLESVSAQMFGDAKNTGDAAAFLVDLRKLHNQGKDDLVKQAVTRIEAVEATVGAMAQTVATVNSTIAARVADVTAPNFVGQVDVAEAAGVAAGDNDAYSYGAWATPFYSQGTQKLKGKTPGYKSKTGGVSVGFDTRANDTMTVGVALSVATDNLKFKGALAGDKTKANTYMFSVYGMQQLTDNWFLQGTASFGNSNMKNTALRVTAGGNQTATGKYDSMTYGGQLLAGYHFPMSDTALVTPMGGLKYNRFNDTGYKETGTTSQNRTISKKSVDKIEGVLGVRATFFTEMSGVNVVPGVHGFVNYDFRGKRPNVTARLDGLNAASLNTDVAKPEKAIYNIGLNVKAMNGTMEYGAGYDAYFAKKYTAHQGSLKVRVNF